MNVIWIANIIAPVICLGVAGIFVCHFLEALEEFEGTEQWTTKHIGTDDNFIWMLQRWNEDERLRVPREVDPEEERQREMHKISVALHDLDNELNQHA